MSWFVGEWTNVLNSAEQLLLDIGSLEAGARAISIGVRYHTHFLSLVTIWIHALIFKLVIWSSHER